MLRILTPRLNLTTGAVEANAQALIASFAEAQQAGAQLLLFPALALTGPTPGDLLLDAAFIERVQLANREVLQASESAPGLTVAFGTVERTGKGLYNTMVIARAGRVLGSARKSQLQHNEHLNEPRYFKAESLAGCVGQATVAGKSVAFTLEDLGAAVSRHGQTSVMGAARPWLQGKSLLVLGSAMPSVRGGLDKRERTVQAFADASGVPVVMVQALGGHDQFVFDGVTLAASPGAKVLRSSAFDSQPWSAALGEGAWQAAQPSAPRLSHLETYRQQMVLGLKDYAARCGFKKVVVGCSGGIDSALTLALAVQALGADNVIGITMPSVFSTQGSVSDSVALCRSLGITLLEHPIAPVVDQFAQGFERATGTPLEGLALENLQARARGTILMEYSNTFGHLLLTTGNKSEVAVGYFTMYGDACGGLGLIGDIYKTEVFALCAHINAQAGRELIPTAILDKPPSAELAPGQRDCDSLPDYPVLDALLKDLLEKGSLDEAEARDVAATLGRLKEAGQLPALSDKVHALVARSEFKRRQAAPSLKMRARGMGADRQMPVAARVR